MMTLDVLLHLLVPGLGCGAILAAIYQLDTYRHFLSIICLAQVMLYAFVAPTAELFLLDRLGSDQAGWYLWLQLGVLVLFLPGYALAFAVKGSSPAPPARQVVISGRKATLLCLFTVTSCVVYLLILAKYQLLFRRLGHAGLAQAYLNLPFYFLFYVRAFDRLVLPMTLLSLLLVCRAPAGKVRRTGMVACLTSAVTMFLVMALNSRFELMRAISLMVTVSLPWIPVAQRANVLGFLRRGIVPAMIMVVGVTFSARVRDAWNGDLANTFSWELLVPSFVSNVDDETLVGISHRLNGLDLASIIAPQADQHGFSYGQCWRPSVVATIGPLWGSEEARRLKASLITSPKIHLLYEYAGLITPDYPSCMLTDAFGNFGFSGLLIAGIVFGGVARFAETFTLNSPSHWALVLGLVAMQVVSRFEGDLLYHILLGWLVQLPAFVLLLALCPLRFGRRRGSATPLAARQGGTNNDTMLLEAELKMQRTPSVTVCIPVYNSEDTIGTTIESALAQSVSPLEVVVVDNCSTDRTWEIISSFTDDRLKAFRNETNLGMYGNFQRCLELAHGEFVRFLCGDDQLEEGTLSREADALRAHPTAVLLSTTAMHVTPEGEELRSSANWLPPGRYRGDEVVATAFDHLAWFATNIFNFPSGILVRRDLACEMDPFDVELLGVADFDFWLRLLGRGDALFVDWQGCRITEHAGRASHSLFWSGDFMRGQLEVARRHLGPGQAKSTLTALLGGRCLWYGLRGLGSFRIGSARVHMNLLRRYGISLPKAIQGLLVAVRHRAMYRLSTGSSLAPPAPKPVAELEPQSMARAA
ncbi:Uncharacterized protein Rv1518 [Durusdinium trenchii]|uniref:Uncharacterized protein Rv1518 n=1 Tax=Durusdinium trenchii TaxID=1381693 RepID=A0ABP0IVU1_9DINO